jgi:hypothetical protein
MLATATLLISAAGGWLADRYGRVHSPTHHLRLFRASLGHLESPCAVRDSATRRVILAPFQIRWLISGISQRSPRFGPRCT